MAHAKERLGTNAETNVKTVDYIKVDIDQLPMPVNEIQNRSYYKRGRFGESQMQSLMSPNICLEVSSNVSIDS